MGRGRASPNPLPLTPGFLALPGFADPAPLLAAGRARLAAVTDDDVVTALFSTKDQGKVSPDYFFASATTASPFFEDAAVVNGSLTTPTPGDGVNKIGHALHEVDATFRGFCRAPALASIFRSLDYARPAPIQSMYIVKGAGVGGEVVPHQDSAFLWTDPRPSVVGCWLALQDAGEGNGCLWAVPGSHKGPVVDRFVRLETGGEGQGGGARPALGFARGARPDLPSAGAVPLPAPAGTLILLHGALVHFSAPNASDASRHAFTVHVIETGGGARWCSRNWLQRPPDMPLTPLYEDGEGGGGE